MGNHGTNGDPHAGGDPRRLLNSGWQWTGRWSDFNATAIAPQYFIAAKHVGGNPGLAFTLNGTNYTIDASVGGANGAPLGAFDSPSSDLRLWKINQTFPSFAPLYNASVDGPEAGKSSVLIGRGTQRGAEVRVNGVLKGWEFGTFDGVQSWGENRVEGVLNGGGTIGEVIYIDFDADGGPNEASLSNGDSSGGWFLQSGGTWKLAGVSFGNDGPWRHNPGDAPFFANIFDAGGLYLGNNPQFIPDQVTDIPASSYGTRISSNLPWIQSVIGTSVVPEPTVGFAFLGLALLLTRRNRAR
jgi:hypothetical protein